jgi:CubicO group peptidase (beta-lactamase class C family)
MKQIERIYTDFNTKTSFCSALFKMRFNVTLLFFSTLFIQSCSAQNNYNFSEVEKIINESITDSAFPGAVILISKDGEIIFNKAYGNFTYDKNSSEVKINTIFDLASLTKVIAATTAAMICTDKNLFSLEDNVVKYIPEFGSNGKDKITIRNLLLHNSGLPSWEKYWGVYENPAEVLRDIYSLKPEYLPGEKFVYSDLGIIVLGKVIEKVTGKSLDIFCREKVFNPLKMNSTFFNPPDSLNYRIAPTEYDSYWRNRLLQGEVHDENAALLNGVAGHAGLFSTAEDLNKLLTILLNKGMHNNIQMINEETVILFTTKTSEQSSRALGWDTKSPKGSSAGNLFSELSYGHTGFTGTSVWTDPARNLIVIFLTNRVFPSRDNTKIIKIRPLIHDAVINSLKK